MEKTSLMVVGAHCGDAEITAGSLVLKTVRSGGSATLVHMTYGEAVHPGRDVNEYKCQKRDEALRCARALGAQARFMEYDDGHLEISKSVQMKLAHVIREVKPSIVLTHWPGSNHPDHRATAENVMSSLLFAGVQAFDRSTPAHEVETVFYTDNWEDPIGFEPDVVIDVTECFEDYLRAVAEYELFRGGVSSFPFVDYYRALGTVRGAPVGYRYGCALRRRDGKFMRSDSIERVPFLMR